MAATSLVLAVASFPLLILPPLAVLCAAAAFKIGRKAQSQNQRQGRRGEGLAKAGTLLSGGLLIVTALYAAVILMWSLVGLVVSD